MKRLLQNIVLFAGILLIIKAPFGSLHPDELELRRLEFAQHDHNAVFIGSSRTELDVISSSFDRETGGKTDSFNFGVPAGLPPETIDWCEEIIRTKKSLKFVFFELSGLAENSPVNKHELRSFSISAYARKFSALPYEKLPFYHDMLALAFFRPEINRENRADIPDPPNHDAELEKKAGALREALARNQRMEAPDQPDEPVNGEYWKRINDLIELAESKQIRIYFYIPPRLETESEFKTIFPIYRRLDRKYKLDPGHDDESLYLVGSSFDEFHLNDVGAALFTKNFAEAFNKREL